MSLESGELQNCLKIKAELLRAVESGAGHILRSLDSEEKNYISRLELVEYWTDSAALKLLNDQFSSVFSPPVDKEISMEDPHCSPIDIDAITVTSAGVE